jgi:hypothetical protein
MIDNILSISRRVIQYITFVINRRELGHFGHPRWEKFRRNPLPARRAGSLAEIDGGSPMEAPPQKTSHCTNCRQVTITTLEDRAKRVKISCPKCNQKYKLHVPYVMLKGEMIQNEE